MTIQRLRPVLLLILVLAGVAAWLAFHRGTLDPTLVEDALRSLGAWAPLVHVVLFALGTVLFVPGALFGLAGGLLFGPVLGTLLNLTGAMLGATAAFLPARHLASDWVGRKAGPRLGRVIEGVEAEGWRFVALVRLVPLFPFSPMNYALGLTRIRLLPYLAASALCMLPGTLAYTWLGYAGREAIGGNVAAVRYGLLGIGELAAIALLPGLVRRFKGGPVEPGWITPEELARQLGGSNPAIVIDVRGPDEFIGPLGHIEQARNLPVNELPDRVQELATLSGRPIVLVCHTDKRSANAARFLAEARFNNVRALRGGMVRWNEAGLPASRAASRFGAVGT